ncbi:unnamed protein product [Oppiella nova]|uniref:Ig-like domain-containing protein n=1 Tax=Oppiella nova TaxID=334625 RepID=A0A7R9QAV1_9ACAR|nr:unnamed protein product [Oppiella nova]CAG2160223.1 unnamed protein product [Oppiella nova]
MVVHVALPCDITPPTLDDQVVLILWYKDEQLAPIYTLDARRGNLEQARTLTSALLDGRAYFNLHNRPAFLQIDPIRVMDAGDYRCRVDFKRARTVNTVISLKVIVPPEEPLIVDMDGNELKGLIGPYNEGDPLKLICTTNGVTTNQLTITSLARHHLLSIFTCQAINNNITVPSSTSITLDLNLKPTEVRITQLTPILVADREAIFECNTFGSRPKAILYWIFDGTRHNTPLNGELQTSTSLTVTLKHAHNGALLTCMAENSKIVDSSVSDELKLDIQYIPQLSLQLGTPTISLQSLQEGNDIYFDCHIDANPRPNAPILWRFNGNVLHPQQGIIQSNVSLVLQRVTRSQSGTYQCEASNQQGIALSNAIHLKIRYAPVCGTEFTLAFGVSLHESVDLECNVEANPAQVSFQWRFDGNTELTNFNQINETSSMLSYAPQSLQEYGTVECMAKNSIGIQQKGCKYHIIRAGPPNFPYMCQVVNQSDNALVILCTGSDHTSVLSANWTANDVSTHKQNQWLNSGSSVESNTQTVVVYPPTYYVCEVSMLSYAPQSLQEYGTVECMAKNSIGIQQKGCKYHIIRAGPPNFPYMCQVVNQSDNALVILCTGSDHTSVLSANWTGNDVSTHKQNQWLNSGSSVESNTQTVVVYPPTYYVCEVYSNSNQYLVANVSLPATLPLSQLSTNSILSDSTNIALDNSINSMSSVGGVGVGAGGTGGTGGSSSSAMNSFQLFVPNLTPATNFKLKLFAANSKGRSDQIWLKAQTLRPAERLVDANSNASNDGSNSGLILRGKPMVMALLIGAGVVTLIVIALGVIAVVRVRRSGGAGGGGPPVMCQHDTRQQQTTTAATLFEEEDDCDGCCGDDCCDEMLLTSTTTAAQQQSQQPIGQQLHSNTNTTKGPPDIIPSFGYLSGGLDNKNFITYAYQTDDTVQYVPQTDGVVHYAELSFCGQPLPQQTLVHPTMPSMPPMLSKSAQQQSVEYAKIEFNKSQTPTQRVNLIGGSPKFESTCPTAFLCISRPVNTSVCEYEGRIYGVGSRIPVKNVCRMCECRDFGRTTREVSAQIDCGIGVECPEEAFGLKPQPNCYFAYERDRCCGQQVCENPLHPKKSTKVCTYKGRRYRLGEKIYPEEDNCKICYCNEDWSDTDPLNSLSCRTHSCDLQLDKDFVSGCLPVYHESSCCPIEYKCPKTVVSSARTSDSKSCWFDGRQYSRGQQMPTDNPCVECVCRTPPEMTCIQKSCPTPPHNCYVGKWDNSVCCQHYTCQPRDHIRDESQFRHNFYSNS